MPSPNGQKAPTAFSMIGAGQHGLGVMGRLVKTGRWQPVSVVDRSAAAYARFQQQFHALRVPNYATVEEALAASQPELVYIATTAPSHVPLARAVLATGFSGQLLIEKPVATSLSEAEALLRALPAASRAGVDFNRRCSPVYHSAKAVIESGELGQLRHIQYRRPMKLSMKGSHYIDLINWFIAAPPRAVTAWLSDESDVDYRGAYFWDPAGTVEIEYDAGRTACVDGLERRPELPAGMTLEFERGRMTIDVAEKRTCLSGPDGERVLADESSGDVFDWIANTFEALAHPGGAYTCCNIVDAISSLAVIVAAYQSHAQGNRSIGFPLSPEAQMQVLRLA